MTQSHYIFIGGLPRTGTTLVRNILNRFDNIAICGETQYFGNPKVITSAWQTILNRAENEMSQLDSGIVQPVVSARWVLARIGDISTDEGARRVVDFMFDQLPFEIDRAYWHWLPQNVDRAQFLSRFLASDRTERALFQLMLACYAGEKPIRGEKTPAHIHYLPTLMSWFPNAKFIHTFRDVRAIFMSQKTKKATQENVNPRLELIRQSNLIYEGYMATGIVIRWLRSIQLHHQYQQRYPNNYYLLKFEDLIRDPETELRALCRFLEIDFAPDALEMKVVNSSFDKSNNAGFERLSINRWQQFIHPITSKFIVSLCGKHLSQFDYQL